MSLTAELKVRFSALQTGSNDLATPAFNPIFEKTLSFLQGTGLNQADRLFVDERTVNASSNDDIDLAGVLTDIYGQTITNAELAALLIYSEPTNLSNLTVGLGSNPFLGFLGGTTPTLGPIRPGGLFLLASPDAAGIGTVGAGSSDILRIANGSGGTATYTIGLLGRSA